MDEKKTNTENKLEENTEILTHNSIYYLRNTSTWIKFISIVGFLVCIMLIAFAIIIIDAPVNTTNIYFAKLNSGMMNFVAVIYILISLILLFPSIYLFVYSKRLKKIIKTNNHLLLENAFAIQKKFWKYIGVLTIIIISFMGIGVVGLFAGTIAGLLVK